ncbi:DnaT-like ssDNA-binding protein [Xenorhabdus sp. SGI240]|uniref:DnaT-like ssDNA-binding protein n=1 Tax=Xenorhabdus sp. SGI240 TaxID=3158262 RepID=UPI0032B8588F
MIDADKNSPMFNSYASIEDVKQFATQRGYSLPDDSVLPSLLFQAMDYLDTKQWKGSKANKNQPLAFPRKGIYVDGEPVPDDVIPTPLINVQCRLAVDSLEYDLTPTVGGEVLSEAVSGAVSVSYAEGTNSGRPNMSWLNSMLRDFLSGSGVTFKVFRG